MADLIQPIMPTESTIGLQAIMRGFEGLAQNRRYAQNVQLQLQQMAQQESLRQQEFAQQKELRQQEFGLEQQRINNQYEVQKEQIQNYKSMEDERKQKLEQLKKADASVAPLMNEASKIPAMGQPGGWGTSDADAALAALQQKYSAADGASVFDTPRGQMAWRALQLKQDRGQRRIIGDSTFLQNQINSAFKMKGADPEQIDYLQQDPDTKDFVPNNVWGKNDNGSVFLSYDANNQVVPPNSGKGVRFATWSKGAAQNLLGLKSKVNQYNSMLTGTGTDTTQQPAQQQSTGVLQSDQNAPAEAPTPFNQGAQADVVNVIAPDGQTVGHIPKANLQRALDAGYTLAQ